MLPLLNHIKKVEFIEARFLKDCTVINGVGFLLNGWRNWQELPTVGLSSATVSTKIVNKNTIYTVKLTAPLKEKFEPLNRHLCYKLTTVTGGQLILGTYDKPFVISTTTDNYPGTVTEKAGVTLTAEYSNIFGLLAILD